MVDDLTEKVQASQNKLEQLMARVPGLAGYKQREQRREADRMLRQHVARKLEEQLHRLGSTQHGLISQGRLDLNLTLERATAKLQLLIDRIRTASYGYAGLFDAVKVDQNVLDRLYAFDEGMLDGVDEIAAAISQTEEALTEGEPATGQVNALVGLLERLNTTFSQRQDVILG
jgi:hypothetical protein